MDVLVPKACFKSVAIYWGVVWNIKVTLPV